MVARDDSVIRGSLIACLIFLVLSLALNFFLWQWGDTQSSEKATASDRLNAVQNSVSEYETQLGILQAMLGQGSFTEAELEEMKSTSASDPKMQEIQAQFAKDMTYFGNEVEAQERSYVRLPEFLITNIRSLNENYASAREDATKIQVDADNKVKAAEAEKLLAETQRDDANKKLVTLGTQFDEDRARMKQENEATKDKLSKSTLDLNAVRKAASEEKKGLLAQTRKLQGTIDTQKLRLNELQQDKFETTQGTVRFVQDSGKLATINLGSADALRPGVTFGVFDEDDSKRLEDAKVKATIQVIQVQGPHLALARVIAQPEIRNPIIPGDKIFSPFWAPGRFVKIALAGDIDIDGDNRPDNKVLIGQIESAGAKVVTGKLDATIRFLVVGEDPELGDPDSINADRNAATIREMGNIKATATELGLTIIPAWKLQSYLKTIDDTITTPFGSAARGEDFQRVAPKGANSRLPSDISEIYKRQRKGMQQGNTIKP
ncbi:MAG: hypothetical protein AB8B91_04635 [Rubripirellula sp.]